MCSTGYMKNLADQCVVRAIYRVQVEVSRLDVADPNQATSLFRQAQTLAPLAGVFHLAMRLRDKMLVNQVLLPTCILRHAVYTYIPLTRFYTSPIYL